MAPLDPLRFLEHLHGHLGWLAAAALVHPAVLLRDKGRRAHLAVGLSVALVTLVASLGVALYGPYRDKLKQGLFLNAPFVGLLFERKEHLAFGAWVLAVAGLFAYLGASRAGEGARVPLRRAAFFAFVAAACLATITAALGTIVASYRTF
jgi:hypothetical protein